MKVTVTDPKGQPTPIVKIDGREIGVMSENGADARPLFEWLARGTGRTEITFKASGTGAHVIDLDPGHGWFTVHPGKRSMAMLAQDGPIHFFSAQGAYYFYVPAAVRHFYVQAAGSGGERVKIAICNPAGEVVDGQSDVSIANRFVITRSDPEAGEIWSIKAEKSPGYYLEDYSLDLYGVPPILATAREALLMP
jgi:hypothetical protein